MPAVSVIITTYNQEQYIAQTIASALAQTFTDHEIIVVDDGSTDNTSTVVASFGERVKYIRQANQGVASSRNTGILQARGDLLAFLDGDDLWEPRKLEVQVGIARLYPDAALIAVDGVQFSHGTILSPSLLAPSVLDCFSGRDSVACVECYPGLIEGNVIYTTSQVMVRRGIFDEVGLSDGTFPLVNDYDLYLRIADRYPFAFSGEKLTKWRYHEGSASGPAGLRHLRWAEDEIGILRKQLGVAPAAYIPAIRRALKRKVYTTSRAAYQNRRQVGVRSTVQYLWRIACKGRIYRWWILLCLMALALPKPVIKRLIVVERLLPGAVRRLA